MIGPVWASSRLQPCLDHPNLPTSGRAEHARVTAGVLTCVLVDGEEDMKVRSLANLGIDDRGGTMMAQDSQNGSQTQSMAFGFSSEKRIENAQHR